MADKVPVSTRNARFQQWKALLSNRAKRMRTGAFLVHGVRPITLAVEHGWTIQTVLHAPEPTLSQWATALLQQIEDRHAPGPRLGERGGTEHGARRPTRYERVEVADELMAELGEKSAGSPELLLVVRTPADDLGRIHLGTDGLVLALDRLTSPGNLGSLIRSADAFGAAGVIVSGHAADVYEPQTVRASTGSVFTVPVVRASSHRDVRAWLDRARVSGAAPKVVGTDESGTVDVFEHEFTGPTVLVLGNETRGMSAGWRDACTTVVRIPIGGSASSLNAAAAGTVVMYEATRQRMHHTVHGAAHGPVPGIAAPGSAHQQRRG